NQFMLTRYGLSAVKSSYTRSTRFIRGKPVYARSLRFISGEIKLYALDTIYTQGNQFMRARYGLSAAKSSYTRSTWFMRGETSLWRQDEDSSGIHSFLHAHCSLPVEIADDT